MLGIVPILYCLGCMFHGSYTLHHIASGNSPHLPARKGRCIVAPPLHFLFQRLGKEGENAQLVKISVVLLESSLSNKVNWYSQFT